MDASNREAEYKKALETGYILALLIVILLIVCFKRYEITAPSPDRIIVYEDFLVEDIPITQQGIPRKRPSRPDVVIPVVDDIIPDDELIEDFDILPFDNNPGRPAIRSGEGYSVEVLPRPIAEVFPEFPKEALKAGAEGRVSLHLLIDEKGGVVDVILLENTTGSSLCVAAAKKAAKRNRFVPAKKSGKNVAMWIVKNYVFKSPK